MMLKLHKKFVVDKRGKKVAIILPFAEWKKITAILEEYEDICAYGKVKFRAASFKKIAYKIKANRSAH